MTARQAKTIREELGRVTREELERAVAKTDSIKIRVSDDEKVEIKAAAQRFGLTVTSYLLALHAFAEELRRERGGRPK